MATKSPSPDPDEPMAEFQKKKHPRPVAWPFHGVGRDPATLIGKHMSTGKSYECGEFGMFAFDIIEEEDPVVLVSHGSKEDGWQLGASLESIRKLKGASRDRPGKIIEAKTVYVKRYKHCVGSDGFPNEDKYYDLEEVSGIALKVEGMKYMAYFWCERGDTICEVDGDKECEHYADLWIAKSGEIDVTDNTTARYRSLNRRLGKLRQAKEEARSKQVAEAAEAQQHTESVIEVLEPRHPGELDEDQIQLVDLDSTNHEPQSPPPDLSDHPKWTAVNTLEGRAALASMGILEPSVHESVPEHYLHQGDTVMIHGGPSQGQGSWPGDEDWMDESEADSEALRSISGDDGYDGDDEKQRRKLTSRGSQRVTIDTSELTIN